jgi:tetratricopeptide (TPR) repeat protein
MMGKSPDSKKINHHGYSIRQFKTNYSRMKFRLFSFFVLFLTVLASFAQENTKQGQSYLEDLQYHKARNFFLAKINASPGDVRSYCWLGDVYLALQLADSARIVYEKARELDSKNPFPLIGLGKIALLKGDRMGKFDFFDKARKLDRKNPEVYNEIAKGCIGLSKIDTATGNIYLKQGFELDSKYAGLHITFGDYEALAEKFGNAINAYERAIFFDPASTLAYRKLGQFYTLSRSYRDAINTFSKSIGLNSDQILVYKYLGDLYYTIGKYVEAEKNYKIYMNKAEVSYDDKERYAIILFFNKKYAEAATLLEDVLKQNSDESVLLRIRGYIAYETGDYAKGLEYMARFFKIHNPEKNIASDYIYYGRLLQKIGRDTLAIENFNKALALDTTKIDIYEDLAKLYAGNMMHDKAVASYKRMITNGADKVNTWFQIGKEYYFEGEKYRAKYDSLMSLQKKSKIPFADSTSVSDKKRLYFQKADSAFTIVTELNPRYPGGFMWKGRINSLLDPEAVANVAKDSYEKAIQIFEAGDVAKNRRSIIEGYKYLGSYYYLNSERLVKADKTKSETLRNTSIDYFRKILALDPNDAQALEVFKKLKIAP